jgi:hypothetical protein
MRSRNIFLAFLLLFGATLLAYGGEVTVTPLSQEQAAYYLNNIARISVSPDFSEQSALVFYNEKGEVVKQQAVNEPVKITFGAPQLQGISNVNPDASKIRVYPNPSSEFIRIEGAGALHTAIYNVGGQVVMTSQGEQINVSSLPAGTYILKVDEEYFKIIVK